MTDRHPFADHPAFDTLDDREKEVLGYFTEGKSSKEICFLITTTERTVDLYRSTLMDKLGLEDPADLIRNG
jgi:DNA-binding NarL/FixJ family response regulator